MSKKFMLFFALLIGCFLQTNAAWAVTYVCNNPDDDGYTGDVEIIGTNCEWSTNVGIGGYLNIPAGSKLTIKSNATFDPTILVQNNIHIRGMLEINSTHNGRDVVIRSGTGKKIYVYGNAELKVTGTNTSTVFGRVVFSGYNATRWRGIEAYAGSRIIFNHNYTGDTATVRFHYVDDAYPGIVQLGGSTSYAGRFHVRGTHFHDGPGIQIGSSSSGTVQMYSWDVVISYNEFYDLVDDAIRISAISIDTQYASLDGIWVCNNYFENIDGSQIVLDDVVTAGGIQIYDNQAEDSASHSFIFMDEIEVGSHIYINNNNSDGAYKGINLTNWSGDGDESIEIKNNVLSGMDFYGIYLSRANSGNPFVSVKNNWVTDTSTSSTSSEGIYVNPRNTNTYGSTTLDQNNVAGFGTTMTIRDTHGAVVSDSILAADDVTARLLSVEASTGQSSRFNRIENNIFSSAGAYQVYVETSGHLAQNCGAGGNIFSGTDRTYPTSIATDCD